MKSAAEFIIAGAIVLAILSSLVTMVGFFYLLNLFLTG